MVTGEEVGWGGNGKKKKRKKVCAQNMELPGVGVWPCSFSTVNLEWLLKPLCKEELI